ncbi:MAG TPA: SelB C-terminal domain-containing protein, partial [Candidatus Wallbacteria bacterium]|nr:SelB C-terminal domain-containing protein [Candidatus Wallbacteria bacterium]
AGITNEKYKTEFYNYILETLLSEKKVAYSEGAYTLTSSETEGFSKLTDPVAESMRKKILAIFSEKTAEPKDIEEVKRPLPKNQSGLFTQTLKFMEFEKQIYKIFENYYISPEQFIHYKGVAEELCRQKGSFTVIEFKEKTGFSRKYAIGILEFFDKINFTARNGNDRIIKKIC